MVIDMVQITTRLSDDLLEMLDTAASALKRWSGSTNQIG